MDEQVEVLKTPLTNGQVEAAQGAVGPGMSDDVAKTMQDMHRKWEDERGMLGKRYGMQFHLLGAYINGYVSKHGDLGGMSNELSDWPVFETLQKLSHAFIKLEDLNVAKVDAHWEAEIKKLVEGVQ